MLDFYMMCCKQWGCSYDETLVKVKDLYHRSGGCFSASDFGNAAEVERLFRLQPIVLKTLPNEVRVAVLEYYGFILGEN